MRQDKLLFIMVVFLLGPMHVEADQLFAVSGSTIYGAVDIVDSSNISQVGCILVSQEMSTESTELLARLRH